MSKFPPKLRSRRGFTLIELLAVIAIIAILIGIVFVGMKSVTGTANAKSTQTTLNNLQSMLSALDVNSRGSLAALDTAYGTSNPLVLPTPDANVTIPMDPTATGGHRYDDFVCLTSTIAMAKILTLPENRAALGKISTKMLVPKTTGVPLTTTPSNILLDAWGNPIIYVPSGGLQGVTLQSQSGKVYRVQSNGVTETTATAKTNARPFFASAGPDGDFSKGDDNIYSFEH
jgi:prepilin-type N-terminal cleavage/methylation domain-containing protein